MNVYDATVNIIKNHWGQGAYFNENSGEYCLVGALGKAKYGNPYRYFDSRVDTEEELLLLNVIREQFPELDIDSLEAFNDYRCRTKEEILLVLEKAARKYDECI